MEVWGNNGTYHDKYDGKTSSQQFCKYGGNVMVIGKYY